MRKAVLAVLGVLLLAGMWACGQPAQQQEQAAAPAAETVKIGALFSVTGPAAFLGKPEQQTAEMFVAELNANGGLNGRQVELLVRDTAGNPEKAVALCQQLINEDKVFAIIGPSTSGESLKVKSICQEAGVLLLSCAAAEEIVTPVLSSVFKTPQHDRDAVLRIFAVLKERGLTRIGVMASNTGFGKAGRAQIEKLVVGSGLTIAIAETYEKEATDLTAVLTKIKAANVQAIINWSIEPAQSIVAKNLRQMNFNVPLCQSHGFGNIQYVQAAGAAAEGIIFPAGRLLVADRLPADHPQRALLLKYKQDYEARYPGEQVSTFGGHAYDALLLLTEAVKKAGSFDRAQVRTALESLTGVVGTAGIFNLSATDHCGLQQDAFEMLTVKDGQFALYAPPA